MLHLGELRMAKMNDSKKRQTFASGAVRDTDDDKPRPDLVSPFALERLGEWLRLGAIKYEERNWERGIPISRSMASLYRHLLKFQQGVTDEDHLAAIMCNAMFIIHTSEMVRRGVLPPSLLDMPKYRRPSSYYDSAKIVTGKDGPKVQLQTVDEAIMRWEDDGGKNIEEK